ncbi:MAG: hypothetical protein UX35_C0003G0120 [Microgenomates group bacterium GW2011_GWA1_46_15]|nr:MAG: hypothetical protein UX00_C0004G0018 [Microgenomates group bacterium GW2011_GWB1_45_17]KKU23984.1 MAG: hypothetical protein UX35_C0003G0120 [Microgenomates group bacterium GW2011_GWA1_46_15]KKU24623.1 MAG: hypothetical protein UX36_C0001G0240 [Microgenomates group bacterium GW2011_GWC1_46_15]
MLQTLYNESVKLAHLIAIVSFFTIFTVLVVSPITLYAQQTPSTFDTAKQAYIATLNTYREKEQQFSVAHEQYLQLQTLALLDVAVAASRNVQLARIGTLTSYFQTLLTYISDLKGLDLTKRAEQQTKIQQILDDLNVQKLLVDAAQDRVALDVASTQFSERQTPLLSTAYMTLALSKIAAMQYAIDQLRIVSTQLRADIDQQTIDVSKKTEKLRGFDELQRTMDIADVFMKKTDEQLGFSTNQTPMSLSTYVRIIDGLNAVYSKVLQAESFVKELAQ